jgi:hypothetical protein
LIFYCGRETTIKNQKEALTGAGDDSGYRAGDGDGLWRQEIAGDGGGPGRRVARRWPGRWAARRRPWQAGSAADGRKRPGTSGNRPEAVGSGKRRRELARGDGISPPAMGINWGRRNPAALRRNRISARRRLALTDGNPSAAVEERQKITGESSRISWKSTTKQTRAGRNRRRRPGWCRRRKEKIARVAECEANLALIPC